MLAKMKALALRPYLKTYRYLM